MSDALRIIPLGGLGEVGKNMTLYEFDGQRILIDAGLAFPRDEHLGVDLVLPDFSHLEDRPLLAIVLTHGHEDHVGALPYVLREIEVGEVIATRLTLAMVKSKLDEHKLAASTTLREAEPDGDGIQIGPFKLEFIRMAHSIPDCVAIVIETPAGRVLHTGDWKLDHTPVDGLKTDVGKLASMGNRGIDLMLGDSTNAERPGMTGSERLVGEAFRQLIPTCTGRILVASFASNIHRMQQAAEVAIANDRKVALVGRSMRKNMGIARNLGYVNLPEDALVSPKEAMDLPPEQGDDPLHGQPGRADVGAHADRLRRSPERRRPARRHGDHLGQAGARATSCASTTRSTGWRGSVRRSCTRRSRRCTSPGMPARRSCARCSRSSGRRR